jgi:exopolyphosphatase/guanosine-5'-triphosphate,3'-diphosphate pyrophosphatase
MMARTGIIDIGSHSVLLLVAESEANNEWLTVADRVMITRLGEGFAPDFILKSPAITRTLHAIDEFLNLCREHNVQSVVAVGTAVLRQALNWQEFSDALLARGVSLWVLSEREEAEFSYLSVCDDPAIRQAGSLAVVDIGGGSVEVAYGKERLQEWFSFPVGALRVREEWLPTDPPLPQEMLQACVMLDEVFAPLKPLSIPDIVATVGGTGVALASVQQGLDSHNPDKLHAFKLEYEHVGKLLERLGSMTEKEREQLRGLEPARAPVIHAGALILERVLFVLRQERVYVSARGLRYGLLSAVSCK